MQSGAIELRSGPLTLQVEPTSLCNLHCAICGRQSWDETRNPPGEMPGWVLDAIRPALPSLLELVIGGYAEPTLGRALWPLLASAREAGCPVRLVTNGTRLDDAFCGKLLEAGLAHLVLSIDGAHEETMRRLRGVGAAATLASLRTMAEAARRLGLPCPELHLSFTATRSNVAELPELIDRAAELGVRSVSAGHLKVYSPEMLPESLFHDPEAAAPALALAQERAAATGLRLQLPRFDRRGSACLMPFQMLFVKWNGDVLGCCSAVFANDHYSLPVGSLARQGLMELWNSVAIRNYRLAFRDKGEYPLPCRDCAFRFDTLQAHTRLLRPGPDGEEAGPR